MFACGRVADVDEMPFELRNVAIERDRCFSDEFEIIDFLGRYEVRSCRCDRTEPALAVPSSEHV